MDTFKIISEQTHRYEKDNLYVILFDDGDNFGIDISNSKANFGRVLIPNKENTQYIFDILNECISEIDDYLGACHYVSSILSYETFLELVLAIHSVGRYIDKLEMFALIRILGLRREERKTDFGTHIVKVYVDDDASPYGEFILVSTTNKFMFHFF